MRLFAVVLMVAALATPALGQSTAKAAEPYKVGTYEISGTQTVGLVLRDRFVAPTA